MQIALLLLAISFSYSAHANDPGDRELIRKTIFKNITKVKACYDQRIKEGLKAGGKLTVTWDIDDTGAAKNFREKAKQLNDRKLFECVTNEMKFWKFPSAPKGETATVNYPFVFASKP